MSTPDLATSDALPAPLTESEVVQYVEIRDRRLALEREARSNEKTENALKARLSTWMAAATRDLGKRRVDLFGHELSLEEVNGRVDFEAEYIKLAGVEAAAALKRHPPKKDRLNVRKL